MSFLAKLMDPAMHLNGLPVFLIDINPNQFRGPLNISNQFLCNFCDLSNHLFRELVNFWVSKADDIVIEDTDRGFL